MNPILFFSSSAAVIIITICVEIVIHPRKSQSCDRSQEQKHLKLEPRIVLSKSTPKKERKIKKLARKCPSTNIWGLWAGDQAGYMVYLSPPLHVRGPSLPRERLLTRD